MLVRRPVWPLLGLALFVVGVAVSHGCASDAAPASTGGGAGSGGSGGGVGAAGGLWGDGSSGAGAKGGGGNPNGGSSGCGGPAPQVDAPPDWERFTGYCGCPIYVPGANGKLPEPVEWEACPSPGPMNPTCRRMKTPWTKTSTLSLAFYPSFWFDASENRAVLQFGRVYLDDNTDNNRRYRIVADVDGPILNAYFEDSFTCTMSDQAVNGGRYAFRVSPIAPPSPSQLEGVIAGELGKPPDTVLENPVGDSFAAWRVSSTWLIRWRAGLNGRHWGSDTIVPIQSAALDPEGEPPQSVRGSGDAVFWEVGGLTKHGVVAWTEKTGQRELIRWLGDYTQGAGNFNTDGIDMVWTHGEGKAPNDTEYPKRSIMTAPFTTDPAVVKATAKRLRSDPGQLNVFPYGIGCGYAARQLFTTDSTQLLVVRLSDGTSWTVQAPPLATEVQFMSVLGVTCDEVFVKVQFPDEANAIVRIRLDSLGPGLPPD
ncbi:MAG: hypothetical protein IPI67_13565 [Myxococcales bacterium]|nr:hypothetical protein [Myxococcales bacterium]